MDKVIFDTNAYRYLVAGKTETEVDHLIERMKDREKANNIVTLMSSIVAKELLAHVASKTDAHYERCLLAIRAMYKHNGDSTAFNMLASPELLISKAFFGKTIPQKIETNTAIGQILFHLATNPSPHTFRKFQHTLNLNKTHVDGSEEEFAKSIYQLLHTIDPDATGWKVFEHDEAKKKKALAELRSESTSLAIANGYLHLTIQLLILSGQIKAPVLLSTINDMAQKFIEVFPEPIALYKYVLECCINNEFNLRENSRSNFVWDIHLMFNVGNHTVGGDKLYFVTDDKAITRTAFANNAKFNVLTFDEYIEYLK